MTKRQLFVLLLALTVGLAGCSGSNSGGLVSYTPEDLGLDPLDQVLTLTDQDHTVLDNAFLGYLQDTQQAGDDANWQDAPYDHYVRERGFK